MSRKLSLPYLDPKILDPERKLALGTVAVISPNDYTVIDGDTIWVLAAPNAEGKREMGFSIRMRSFSCPEKVTNTKIEAFYRKMKAPSRFTRGDAAKNFLTEQMKGRPILYVPTPDPETRGIRKDDRKRALADVYISGAVGGDFEIANAKGVADLMIQRGYGTPNPDEKPAEKRAQDAIGLFLGSAPVSAPAPQSIFDDLGPKPGFS